MKINFEHFCNLISGYYQYMGRDKRPAPDTKDLWFKKLKGYQETEIVEAFEHMKDSLDSIPYNIPKAIKRAVVAINMAKCASSSQWTDYGECESCNGSGGFTILVFDNNGVGRSLIQYCSKCDNFLNYCNDPSDRISANELSGVGYKFKPLNQCLMVPTKINATGTRDDIKQLASKTIGRM